MVQRHCARQPVYRRVVPLVQDIFLVISNITRVRGSKQYSYAPLVFFFICSVFLASCQFQVRFVVCALGLRSNLTVVSLACFSLGIFSKLRLHRAECEAGQNA